MTSFPSPDEFEAGREQKSQRLLYRLAEEILRGNTQIPLWLNGNFSYGCWTESDLDRAMPYLIERIEESGWQIKVKTTAHEMTFNLTKKDSEFEVPSPIPATHEDLEDLFDKPPEHLFDLKEKGWFKVWVNKVILWVRQRGLA